MKKGIPVFIAILIFSTAMYLYYFTDEGKYPWKRDIIASVFWVGEASDADNGYIPNDASAWDGEWMRHYGGVDDPSNRNGWLPRGFIPRENPFYAALPYNDFDANGNRKENSSRVFWAKEKGTWYTDESMLKNRWIQVRVRGGAFSQGKSVYVQWEDVGPEKHDDVMYVFGSARPDNTFNLGAGIDISPAARDYLSMGESETVESETVDWRFEKEEDVPPGPWRTIVTDSGVRW